MKELQRYERALQIALGRLGTTGAVHVDGEGAVAAVFDLHEALGETGAAQVRDVYRLVNAIEDLEHQAGIQHVRVRAKAEGKEILARLEAVGYEVRLFPEIGPRDAEVSWIAMAFYEGRVVAHAYGDTKEEALQGLVGEVAA